MNKASRTRKLSICCQPPSAGSKQRFSIKVIASNHGRAEKDIETMRNSLLLLAAFAGLAIFAMPAAAESDKGSCEALSSVAPSGPIDLEAIPMKDPTGPKAIRGIGDDECDDKPANAIAGEDDTSDDD